MSWWSRAPSGRACLDLLHSGAADVAASAEFAVAMSASYSADTAILASMSESTAQIKLNASRRAGIRGGTDLVGKRIATVMDTSAQYFADQWLVYQGIDPRRVTLSFMSPDSMGAALQRGRSAAVVIWEPEAGRIQAQLGDDALVLPSARVYMQHFCVVARTHAVGRNRTRFDKLLRGLLAAQRFIADHPAEARAILAGALRVSDQVAGQLMDEQDYRLALHASLQTTMLSQLRWQAAQQEASVGKRLPSISHLIDASLLQAIAPAAVTLAR